MFCSPFSNSTSQGHESKLDNVPVNSFFMMGTIGNEVLYVKKISISTTLLASEKKKKKAEKSGPVHYLNMSYVIQNGWTLLQYVVDSFGVN